MRRMSADTANGPLEGVRVIELGGVVAAPFAGRLLGDYGADVIKVEAPDHPDPLRDWGQASYGVCCPSVLTSMARMSASLSRGAGCNPRRFP